MDEKMTQQELVTLMESSQTEKQWNDNCDHVNKTCGGYPGFWFKSIVMSGLMGRVSARWGGTDQIQIVPFDIK